MPEPEYTPAQRAFLDELRLVIEPLVSAKARYGADPSSLRARLHAAILRAARDEYDLAHVDYDFFEAVARAVVTAEPTRRED